ncbi:hypothetical protein CKN80_12915 [Carnobacterium divergens]|uniref:hypothetical protein n=1 Tax=Carnobacterium divergens TaxID=2748 RepID=UPI0010723B09|nr:hypothetical protein [Carnobacterium divergens]TFJ43445.1 hypothetical protein CKN79_12910 [Carnobacterium divergens]TFJ50597.1 hypothetical protein CKN80_12915 [Carnobacterium divergens]
MNQLYKKLDTIVQYMIGIQIFATVAILIGGFYIKSQISYIDVNMAVFVIKALAQGIISVVVLCKEKEEPSMGKAMLVLILAVSIGFVRFSIMLSSGLYVSYGLSGIALVVMAIVLVVYQAKYDGLKG